MWKMQRNFSSQWFSPHKNKTFYIKKNMSKSLIAPTDLQIGQFQQFLPGTHIFVNELTWFWTFQWKNNKKKYNFVRKPRKWLIFIILWFSPPKWKCVCFFVQFKFLLFLFYFCFILIFPKWRQFSEKVKLNNIFVKLLVLLSHSTSRQFSTMNVCYTVFIN